MPAPTGSCCVPRAMLSEPWAGPTLMKRLPAFRMRCSPSFGPSTYPCLVCMGDIEDHDLLPDLVRQTCGQRLDVAYRIEHDWIAQVLRIESGRFAGEREQLGAIVEVAPHLGTREVALGRGCCRGHRCVPWVFGELVHVHHVHNAAQSVQRLEGGAPLEAFLERDH